MVSGYQKAIPFTRQGKRKRLSGVCQSAWHAIIASVANGGRPLEALRKEYQSTSVKARELKWPLVRESDGS